MRKTTAATTTMPLFGNRALVFLTLCCLSLCVTCLVPLPGHCASETTTTLFSTTPPRQPRRNLKKRRRSNNKRQGEMRLPNTLQEEEFPWDTAESRPLVSSKSKEAGEDYWIDEQDLAKSIQRKQAIQNRKAMEGEMPKEKLWSEVFAPYKQNWIGIFSVGIVILATIVTKFPELLNQPVIPIPDL